MENSIITFDKLPDYQIGLINIYRNNKFYSWILFDKNFWDSKTIKNYNNRYKINKVIITNEIKEFHLKNEDKIYLVLEVDELCQN